MIPGLRNMLFGVCWVMLVAIATAVFWHALAAAGKNVVPVFYMAIAIGGIQFVLGLFQCMGWLLRRAMYRRKSDEGQRQYRAKVASRAMVTAMAAAAAANGPIDDAGYTRIAMIYKDTIGETIDAAAINKIAWRVFHFNDFGIVEVLRRDVAFLDQEMVPCVFAAACRIAAADDSVNHRRTKVLTDIAKALRIKHAEASRILSESAQSTPLGVRVQQGF
jgi:hypothetical protein